MFLEILFEHFPAGACFGTSTTRWYFDDKNVWWINLATLCLHLTLPSDLLTLPIHPSETTASDGLTPESLHENVHQCLSCLGTHFTKPRSNTESWEEGLQKFLQVVQDNHAVKKGLEGVLNRNASPISIPFGSPVYILVRNEIFGASTCVFFKSLALTTLSLVTTLTWARVTHKSNT